MPRTSAIALTALALAGAGVGLGCGDVRLYPLKAGVPDASIPPDIPPVCPTSLVGFATLRDGTTGGSGGEVVTVDTPEAFAAAAIRVEPLVIQVNGMITLPEQTDVASDKTVLGLGANSGFTGKGLDLSGSQNVILRNLIISKPVKSDAISLDESLRIWIDHCELSSDRDNGEDFYDGLVDVTHASDFVTISWTIFRDHFKTTLVGHSADNVLEDDGHLTVTYHHNAFFGVETGIRIRFGTVHAFNNYFRDVPEFGVVSQMGAEVLVENNFFENVGVGDPAHYAITTVYMDPEEGLAQGVGNVFIGGERVMIRMQSQWSPSSPSPLYFHDPEPAENARALVQACAGVGKISP